VNLNLEFQQLELEHHQLLLNFVAMPLSITLCQKVTLIQQLLGFELVMPLIFT